MAGLAIPIVGLGASTPVGRNVWSSAAAVRAGICGFREHPFMIDTAGEPMRVAMAPWLPVDMTGVDRFVHLLEPALAEVLSPLTATCAERRLQMRIGLALALPPDRPGLPAELAGALKKRLVATYAGTIQSIATFNVGHAGGIIALDSAVTAFNRGSLDACIVAGVDSYMEPETLEWLEECDQLHGAGPLNNAWGFVPGEAAGAILVANPPLCLDLGLESLGKVRGIGIGRETKLIKTDSVCVGEGLTQAFRAALQSLLPGEQIQNVFCDMNGDRYRADEFGFSVLRTKEKFRAASEFIAPADCWGDVGAAGGPLHTALAVIAHRKRYGKGPLSMVWASSESGERGAAVIQALDQREA